MSEKVLFELILDKTIPGFKKYKSLGKTTTMYSIPKDYFSIFKNDNTYEKFDNALYFLVDETNTKIYIGESTDFFNRINDHLRDESKRFFNRICIITDKAFDKSLLKELETKFIHFFKKAEYTLENANEQDIKKIRDDEITEIKLNLFINLITDALFLLEIPIVEDKISKDTNIFVYGPDKKGIYGELVKNTIGWTLREGAIISETTSSALSYKSAISIRNDLKESLEDGKKLTRNISCTSPSQAGAIITGRNFNGMEEFKKNGKPLSDFLN